MRRGQEPDAPPGLREFCEATKRARAASAVALVEVIRVASTKQWQAAAWLLERREPSNWGRRDAMGINFDLTRLSSEELLMLDELLAKAEPDDFRSPAKS